MRFLAVLVAVWLIGSGLWGCETVHEVTKTGGKAIGEGANALGGLSEGGSEAIQGPVTNEENPYGR